MLNDLEAREALHVLVLHQLAEAVPPGTVVLKGGVNLRLFFGSRRYSEDLDLDLEPRAQSAYVAAVRWPPALSRRRATFSTSGC